MPPEIIQTMPQLYRLALPGNKLCDVDDCSCCEIEPFLQMIAHAPVGLNRSLNASFKCGSTDYKSKDFTHYKLFPPHFPSCQKCTPPDPLDIQCRKGSISSFDMYLEVTDALLIRFTGDTSTRCNAVFHDLYYQILELGNMSQDAQPQPGSSAAVTLYCRGNWISVWGPDPQVINPLKVIVDTDFTPSCHDIRTKFLQFIRNEYFTDHAPRAVSLPVIPIKSWIEKYLACPLGAPLFVRCIKGAVIYSQRLQNQTRSTVLKIRGDSSLRCREFVSNCHNYLIQKEGSNVQDDEMYSNSQESIVAVCQRGRTILSESSPESSLKLHLTYYSVPNNPCQQKYRDFLNFIEKLKLGLTNIVSCRMTMQN
ncbi:uncharacterized protein LOC129590723 [Paramacrobiotus metropolitanus]|uniref:uncharacterized protein LOC129590723 n=1 Tax=Paramacrobiotus metropolitanus TaxID=2943436 RepID=UPI0024462B4D|nr:uncharacterized protein LOC129590723 [Paramacrobiotus metropolitanus]